MMNRHEKAKRRDGRAWLVMAILLAAAAVFGALQLSVGHAGWESVAIPAALATLCFWMRRWTGKEHHFSRKGRGK